MQSQVENLPFLWISLLCYIEKPYKFGEIASKSQIFFMVWFLNVILKTFPFRLTKHASEKNETIFEQHQQQQLWHIHTLPKATN